MDFKYSLECDNDSVMASFIPVLNDIKTIHTVKRTCKDQEPFSAITVTTDMRDFIANVDKISGKTCEVYGVYRGKAQKIRNVLIMEPDLKLKQRIMITEYLNLDGKMVFMATKSRILQGDCNYYKFGWTGEEESYLTIDIYTGESKETIRRG